MRRFGSVGTDSRRVEEAEDDDDDDEDEEQLCSTEIDRSTTTTSSRPPIRRSFHRKSTSLVSSLPFSNMLRSLSYDMLIQNTLHLTVVKLDGSRFGIEVNQNATVAELKRAVQSAFSHIPREGPEKICWGQVWGHFCLSYNGCKLVDDNRSIKDFDISEDDELQFTRHDSAVYNRLKKKSLKKADVSKSRRIFELQSSAEEEGCDHLENLKCSRCLNKNSNQEEILTLRIEQPVDQQHTMHKNWPPLYSKLEQYDEAPIIEDESYPSGLAKGLVGCFNTVFCSCCAGRRGYPPRVSRIEV